MYRVAPAYLHPRLLLSLPIIALFCLASQAHAEEFSAKDLDFFEKKIRPVLVKQCYKCHSADSKEVKGGLRLDTREHMLAGGESGDAMIPGNPDDSLLLQALRFDDLEMPPSGKLSEEVIADFKTWIARGAADPRIGDKPVAEAKQIDWEEARRFWAFQPIERPAVPKVKDRSWPANPIDHFILARLEAENLKPAPDADRHTLVRRLYLDLIGLPPTPEETQAFVRDDSPEALPRLVDKLLASERFGERWGRHWLDVARYAESTGLERNQTYPHAWRYRDYVIDAFNEDRPYDRFITEQIAGDLLEHGSAEERRRHLIATGFLAIGTKGLNERNRLQFDMNIVDDQIDTTGRAVLGMTIGCARCHDHKFDPIPTADYYALAGIFRSSETMFGSAVTQGVRQRSSLMPLDADSGAPSAISDRELQAEQRAAGQLANDRRVLQQKLFAAKLLGDDDLLDQLRKKMRRLEYRQSSATQSNKNTGPVAMAVREAGQVADCPIYLRGEIDSTGARVPRGFLTVIARDSDPAIPVGASGRLELAQWLTSRDNPLTARVFVNRVWQHLFGIGIVGSSGNFGASGELPSNGELLDWLADDCLENGWSRKQVIRTLVLSRAYRMSNEYQEAGYKLDPENRLHWRHNTRRLDAEVLRDSMLAISGELDTNRPQGSIVSALGLRIIGQNQLPASRNSSIRGVYLPIIRDVEPEFLTVFDFADPGLVVSRRQETTAPTQALYLMNSEFVRNRAEQFAAAALSEKNMTDEQRINRMIRSALVREPATGEVKRASKFIEDVRQELANKGSSAESAQREAWALFAQTMFAASEFRYMK